MTDCIVIGAGLAGASMAHQLALRGKRVLVLEREASVAAKASSNDSAILSPYLTNKDSVLAKVYSAGFAYSQNFLKALDRNNAEDLHIQCGAIQFPSTPRMQRIFEARKEGQLEAHELEKIIGSKATPPAFHIPESGVVNMPKLIKALLDHDYIEIKTSTEVKNIIRTEQVWSIEGGSGPIVENVKDIIVCSAYEASVLPLLVNLPLEAVRGEIWKLMSESFQKIPEKVFLFGGYLTLLRNDRVTLGGSFKHQDFSLDSDPNELEKLTRQIKHFMPDLLNPISLENLESWVGFRTSTHDRLPYIGPVPDFNGMQEQASKYRSGSNIKNLVPTTFQPGLWVSVGHGSRGLTTCLLASEIIARIMLKEDLGEYENVYKEIAVSRLLK